MSSPIKPPGKPPGPPAAPDADPASPKASFDAALDEAAKTEAASATKEAISQEALAAIAKDVAAGKIDASQAVDALVARALGGPTAAVLPPARRAELEAHLRRALTDDPTLAALTQDLERGG